MSEIKIELRKTFTKDVPKGEVTMYALLPLQLGIAEAERFSEVFEEAILMAKKWQYGNRYADAEQELPKGKL